MLLWSTMTPAWILRDVFFAVKTSPNFWRAANFTIGLLQARQLLQLNMAFVCSEKNEICTNSHYSLPRMLHIGTSVFLSLGCKPPHSRVFRSCSWRHPQKSTSCKSHKSQVDGASLTCISYVASAFSLTSGAEMWQVQRCCKVWRATDIWLTRLAIYAFVQTASKATGIHLPNLLLHRKMIPKGNSENTYP